MFGQNHLFNIAVIIKAIRYFASSALALAVDVSVMWAAINYLSLPILWSASLGFTIGCFVNYAASKYFVFENKSSNTESVTITLFFLVGIAGLILNNLIIYIGVNVLSVHLLLTKLVSAGTVFCFNFLVRGLFVFKDPDLCKIQKKM